MDDGQSTAERAALPSSDLDRDQLSAHYGWVHAVARNLVRDPWGAEDVTQETLLAALAAPPRDVPDDQRLRAWLGRVAFNLSRLGARQGARRRAREARVARAEALPSVSEELEAAGTLRALSAAVAGLAEPYRGVVVMRYFDGLSTAEIAARTGVTELAVRKRLWRARGKLRAALDHDPHSGQLLVALLPFAWVARVTRTPALSGLAAGLALCAGATWWWSGSSPRGERVAVAALVAGVPGRAALDSSPDAGAQLEGESSEPAGPRVPARRPRAPGGETSRTTAPPPLEDDEPPARLASGIVLDLEGDPRAGLELFDPERPARILAESDAAGGFRVAEEALPLTLAARAEGLATVAPARLARGNEDAVQPLVVAEAADLTLRVVAESGRPVAQAELALRVEESAFARIPLPVRLESAVVRRIQADAAGLASVPALARGDGLFLTVGAAGFETLVLDTRALGRHEWLVLRALPDAQILAGTVLHRDGRPVGGAVVRLGATSTSADARGRFHLPLRGVDPDSALEASDPDRSAAPVEIRGFGARLRGGVVGEVELVLGEPNDTVEGRLLGQPAGNGSAGNWIVAAYRSAGGERDADGREAPVASTRSDAAGAFTFALPRGTYDVYALAPDRLALTRRAALETRAGAWCIELAPPGEPSDLRGELRTSDGRLLAAAAIEVRARLDGGEGRRTLAWREIASDAQGLFAFARDPAVAFELEVEHPAAVRQCFSAAGAAPLALVMARRSFLQVAGAGAHASSCALLDAAGHALTARGPLGARAGFSLRDGSSAVLEVPSAARWLELRGAAEPVVRIPVAPREGEIQEIRP